MKAKENNLPEHTPKVSIQKATPDDLDKFMELEGSVHNKKTYPSSLGRDDLEEEMKKGIVYFIKSGDDIVGNVSYEIKGDDHAYISGLMVLPAFQGQGIGRQAMAAVMEELKDFKRVDLVTHPDNAKAISLYSSLGFVIESRKENYFGDGEPRVVMSKLKD